MVFWVANRMQVCYNEFVRPQVNKLVTTSHRKELSLDLGRSEKGRTVR